MINVGFNNFVASGKIVSVINYNSTPARRLVNDARENGRAVDGTQGAKTECLIITETNHVILSNMSAYDVQAEMDAVDYK